MIHDSNLITNSDAPLSGGMLWLAAIIHHGARSFDDDL